MTSQLRRIATLLIANRGEIAVRIAATARRMGLRSVAVYAEDDRWAFHVAAADSAVRLPGDQLPDTYLNIHAIIAAAKTVDADAVHPGYGFLSENAAFAEACAASGLTFVGPDARAMRTMGDKGGARRRAAALGIPVLPGYDGDDQSEAAIITAAAAVGYPLLIKPSAGGGGKGMRVVARAADLKAAIDAAKREAKRAFGDDRLILERYVESPRHVEVQVMGDGHGNAIHLLDRDCSVQRRYQKLIEEAPAPDLADALRSEIRGRAVQLAKSVNYAGAGTVEFLVAGDHFFFMEMNTRLQVEHPATEAVTGIDLVEWQIRIARGEPLPLGQEEVVSTGHAIEARVLAEDPAHGFVPQAGRIAELRLPNDVRVDTGVRAGDVVPLHYDPLIAKIIATGPDRSAAIARLGEALAATAISGIATNRTFLSAIVAHPVFRAGPVDTGFIAAHREELLQSNSPEPRIVAVAAFAVLRLAEAAENRVEARDPYSPWADTSGWRLGARATCSLRLAYDGKPIEIGVTYTREGYQFAVAGNGGPITVTGTVEHDGRIRAAVRIGDEEVVSSAFVVARLPSLAITVDGVDYAFEVDDPRTAHDVTVHGDVRLTSPMPGQIVAVMIQPGQQVATGEPLVVVEAMKMEHTVSATRSGRVARVNVAVGDRVAGGVTLVEMEDEA